MSELFIYQSGTTWRILLALFICLLACAAGNKSFINQYATVSPLEMFTVHSL